MVEDGRCFYCESSINLTWHDTISSSRCYYCKSENQMYLRFDETCEYAFFKIFLGRTNTDFVRAMNVILKKRHIKAKNMKNPPILLEKEGAWEQYVSGISKDERCKNHYGELLQKLRNEVKEKESLKKAGFEVGMGENLEKHKMDVEILEKITKPFTHPLRLVRLYNLVVRRKEK